MRTVFHSTRTENVSKIREEGLLVNPPDLGFTFEAFRKTIKKFYGMVPIHVALNTEKANVYSRCQNTFGYTRLTIALPDSYEIHLRPDLGHLVELGAYVEEDEIYFMGESYVPKEIKGKFFTSDELQQGDVDTATYTRLTQTACIMANIPPEFIS